jgi:hypothetical protein
MAFFPIGSCVPARKRIPPLDKSIVVPVPESKTLPRAKTVQPSSSTMRYRRFKRLSPLMQSIGIFRLVMAPFGVIDISALHSRPSMRARAAVSTVIRVRVEYHPMYFTYPPIVWRRGRASARTMAANGAQ